MTNNPQLDLAERLALTDANRSFGLSQQVIIQAIANQDSLLEIRASLLGAYTALRLGEFSAARVLLAKTFAHLEPKPNATNEQLQLLYSTQNSRLERLLNALSIALEQHDIETHGHIARVVGLSQQLAGVLGLSQQETFALRIGAYLHDIGKIAMPSQILQKPGALSLEERQIIEQHSLIGHHIAMLIPEVPIAALEVILYHHERFDGTGYPTQKHAFDIPRLAHIFSIIDVYDALIQPRPYKPAWELSKVVDYFEQQRNQQFQSELVSAFLPLIQNL